MTVPPIAVDDCANEPIRVPGAIQPHGWLIAVDPATGQVLAWSGNWESFEGWGSTSTRTLQLQAIVDALRSTYDPPIFGRSPTPAGTVEVAGHSLEVSVHLTDRFEILEFERATSASSNRAPIYALAQRLLPHLHRAASIEKLLSLAVMELKRMSGFGRVLAYRFDAESHGEVLAESRDSGYDTYAGHRFPAMDIPPQARELYRLNHIRLIPDANYTPVALQAKQPDLNADAIDLSFASLRSVSPVHLEYMRNMGTLASMSVSIVVRDQLWGLISCHNHTRRYLDQETRAACEHLGRLVSLQIAAKEEQLRLAEALTLRELTLEIVAHLSHSDGSLAQLVHEPSPLLRMARAGGAAVVLGDRCWTAGITPTTEEVQALSDWLASQPGDVFHADALSELFPPAIAHTDTGAGVLAISLSQVHKHLILWFRPETIRTVRWAGEPRKAALDDEGRLHPRRSFASWEQLVRGQSIAWRTTELDGASELRVALLRIVLRRAQERAEAASELARLNRDLEAFSAFNREIANAIPGLVAYWDRELHIRFANPAYARWLASTPEELTGRSLRAVCGNDHMQFIAPWVTAALQGEVQHFELEDLQANGSRFVHQMHLMPQRSAAGEVQGIYVMAFDITALKVGQASLQTLNDTLTGSRDAAQFATRAKSAFLANMSHEIRTPMNAIIGLTHLLSRDSRDPQQRDRLRKITDAAKHLSAVINDVLELSKIEAGKLTLLLEDFALDDLVSRSFEMVRERAHEKGLELILDTGLLPSHIHGDSTRLSQMLINLLSNAVKFTDHGWVWLRSALVQSTPTELLVRFEVQDTGEGISERRQASLFNAFEQADNSPDRRNAGTGLGLALTRQLAVAMNGEAGVISTPGVGSTFWFTAWVGVARRADTRHASIAMDGLHVLLVDDLPESLEVIGGRLRMMGLRVDAHRGGPAALRKVAAEIAAGRVYDLVLLDADMEGMDGIETLRLLRPMLGVGTPPSILMAAKNDPVMLGLASVARFDAVLTKPVTASELHDALTRALTLEKPPVVSMPVEATAAEASLRARHAGQRILLVEDNAVNREVAEGLLQAVGLTVETAENGESGLLLAQSGSHDLILMDMQMPVLDGMEVTRRLRSGGATLPIIAMTANAFAEDRAACLAAGMNDHVSKPVDPSLLYGLLLLWLPQRQMVEQKAPAAPMPPGQAELTIARLSTIDGLDTQALLRYVGGRHAIGVSVLRGFALAYEHGAPVLLNDASDADDPLWQRTCHSVRGAASTVGAVACVDKVLALERASRAERRPPDLSRMASELHFELIALSARIASRCGPADGLKPPAASSPRHP